MNVRRGGLPPRFEVLVCECCVCEMLCGGDVCGMLYCGMLCLGDVCGTCVECCVRGMFCEWNGVSKMVCVCVKCVVGGM